jgi:hypothetical protein
MNAGRDALRANGRPSFMTILLTGCVISGIVTGVLGFLMHVEVNSNLPEADRLPWTRRFRPSVSELSSLYDKLYPQNFVTSIFRLACISSLAFGISIIVVLMWPNIVRLFFSRH